MVESIPDHICLPAGAIGEVAKFTLQTSALKHPEFALSAGLAFVSVVTGRKVIDETGTTGNLYLLNLGPTGCGKDSYRKALKKILQDENLLSGERFTGDSALLRELSEQPSRLAIADEIGTMIQNLNNNKADSNQRNLADALVQAYTSAGSIWHYKAYADPTNSKTVYHPNFVIYGSGNAATLFRSLKPEKVTDGFVGRFTMFLSSNGGGHCDEIATLAADRIDPQEDEYSPLLDVPQGIRDFIDDWKSRTAGGGNLDDQYPKPMILTRTPEAAERLEGHFCDIHHRNISEAGTIRGDLWARASEKTAKFALLSAVSRSATKIEIQDANWAIALSNFLTRRLVSMCTRHVAETPWDAKRLEILNRIVEHGRPILHSDLLKASRIKSKDFKEIIANLSETGEILLAVKPTQGRPATAYVASNVSLDNHPGWVVVTEERIVEHRKQCRK